MIRDARNNGATKAASVARTEARRGRDAAILALRGRGLTQAAICARTGLSASTVYKCLRRLQSVSALVEEALVNRPVTADELHVTASDMLRADILDIYECSPCKCGGAQTCPTCGGSGHVSTGKFRPISAWPRVWRDMLQECQTEPVFERSTDGVQGGALKSWDEVGQRVKYKFLDRLKLRDHVGRLKSVDAFVNDRPDANAPVQRIEISWQIGPEQPAQRVIEAEIVKD